MPTPNDLETMANRILADGFQRSVAPATELSDPIVDTPMVLTLEQLRPYDFDPRITRNPRYDEIKASIKERGLDAPPAVTRRPGDPVFMIRNGGNSRLAILRELWSETKDEHFFKIPCLFRPWPKRGDIVALTGHLAESDLHGSLTFIERALGVEKTRELYEKELARPLSQKELAKLLCADGYPIQQSHISRMRDAVQYLLPAIPTVLYGGLGRHQVERLAILRKSAERAWEQASAGKTFGVSFPEIFQDVLVLFDSGTEHFSSQRIQDELIGQMANHLDADYDTLALEISIGSDRQQVLNRAPAPDEPSPTTIAPFSSPARPIQTPENLTVPTTLATTEERPELEFPPEETPAEQLLMKTPATERLTSIQNLIADHVSPNAAPELAPLESVPLDTNSLYRIDDIWHIDPGLDVPHRLRIHINQFAREIAEEAGHLDAVVQTVSGLGFLCTLDAPEGALSLLHALDKPGTTIQPHELLLSSNSNQYLSDESLIKIFRLIRLARRLNQLECTAEPQ